MQNLRLQRRAGRKTLNILLNGIRGGLFAALLLRKKMQFRKKGNNDPRGQNIIHLLRGFQFTQPLLETLPQRTVLQEHRFGQSVCGEKISDKRPADIEPEFDPRICAVRSVIMRGVRRNQIDVTRFRCVLLAIDNQNTASAHHIFRNQNRDPAAGDVVASVAIRSSRTGNHQRRTPVTSAAVYNILFHPDSTFFAFCAFYVL